MNSDTFVDQTNPDMIQVRILKWFLRVVGFLMSSALVFVVVPRSWMRDIHVLANLGPMPDAPIVWYHARSTSALYSMFGGLFLILSFDIPRHFGVLKYLGWTTIAFGTVLCGVDVRAAMPVGWIITEGPFVIFTGSVMLYLISHIETRGNKESCD